MANECNAPERKFDPYKFSSLVTLVIDQRSVNDFCKVSGVCRSIVSRAINFHLTAQPTKKLYSK